MLVTVKVFFLAPPALPSNHSISYTSGKQLAVLPPVDFADCVLPGLSTVAQ